MYKINRILLYNTGNYSQYLIMNHNGKEYGKEYTHTRVCAQRTTYSMCVSVFHFQVFALVFQNFGYPLNQAQAERF